jgi:hypothetical protein
MTNKLPVVGRVYQHKTLLGNFKCTKVELVNNYSEFVFAMKRDFADFAREYSAKEISDFEELPENEAETKPKTQNHISELSLEVKEAMEGLRKAVKRVDHCGLMLRGEDLYDLSQNLLNALDKQFSKTSEAAEKLAEPETKTSIFSRDKQQENPVLLSYTGDGVIHEAHFPTLKEALEAAEKTGKETRIVIGPQVFPLSKEDADKHAEAEEAANVREEEVKEEESIWKDRYRGNVFDNDGEIVFLKKDDQISFGSLIWHEHEGKYEFLEIGIKYNDKDSASSFVKLSTPNFDQVTTISDFINDFEKLKERVKKLEVRSCN